MKLLHVWKWVGIPVLLSLLWGCGAQRNYVYETERDVLTPQTTGEETLAGRPPVKHPLSAATTGSTQWTMRRMGVAELLRYSEKEPDLSPSTKLALLARLNTRAKYYIDEDIKSGRPLKVPNDFSSFRHWTPLPRYLPAVMSVPKFVLVVKDIPFIGWYERGELVGDTYICIGKQDGWTEAGIYRVLDKDVDHISRSYTNAYGVPAPMPWALRIYEHVWIHAGDITGGYCSHGCINLPLTPAVDLFNWADSKTVVSVVDSLNELDSVFEQNQSNCTLYAHKCDPRQTARN